MVLPSDPATSLIPERDTTDWFTPDTHLQWLVRRSVGESIWPVAESALQELGHLVPQRIDALARSADRNPPVLRSYDAIGRRIDEIEFHPSYVELEKEVLKFGVVRAAYIPGWRGLQERAPRPLISAMLYMFLQADQAVTGCPIGMMDAMARCLERNDPELARRFVPRLADDTGEYFRSAMFLTEKAGGSDVGANQTVARRDAGGNWRLNGEKWFASCAHSDLILVMARPEGAPPGPKGLGLFLMPRILEDGSRNSFVIHRLKEKFGTRAMASGEVGLRDAFAWPVGDINSGMRQMMDMVSLTRVGIVSATAGAMRRNAYEALTHTSRRKTFGGVLGAHPLMRDTLADLVVDSVAALTAAIGISEVLDLADAGNSEAQATLRMLTPLWKMHGTERARICATEAMEVRGGNGFIEDWPDSRILRDVYVHAIWEGSGNVIALDALRAVQHGALPGFAGDTERRLESLSDGIAAPLAIPLLQKLHADTRQLEGLAAETDPGAAQLALRRTARRLAQIAIAARLAEQANEYANETGNGRLAWIAARFTSRLWSDTTRERFLDDAEWLNHADALLFGNATVPVEFGRQACEMIASQYPAVN